MSYESPSPATTGNTAVTVTVIEDSDEFRNLADLSAKLLAVPKSERGGAYAAAAAVADEAESS
jgi:hypothetical protein